MKTQIIIILLSLFYIRTYAQDVKSTQDCDFFKNLRYKNGVDTVVVLSNIHWVIRNHVDSNLKALGKRKKLKVNDYIWAISFKVVGCDSIFVCNWKRSTNYAFNLVADHENTILKLRCIVYEGFSGGIYGSYPYFVIDKVEPYLGNGSN